MDNASLPPLEKARKIRGFATAIEVVVRVQGITTKREQEAAISDLKEIESLADQLIEYIEASK